MTNRLSALAAITVALMTCAGAARGQSSEPPQFDFMTTQFEKLQVAARLSEAIRVAPDSFVATATLESGGETVREEPLTLIQSDPAALEALAEEVGPAPAGMGETVLFRLAPEAIATIEAIRGEIKTLQAKDQKGSFSINVASNELCRVSDATKGEMRVDIFLKSSESGRFVAMVQGADLRQLFADTPGFPEALKPCPGVGG